MLRSMTALTAALIVGLFAVAASVRLPPAGAGEQHPASERCVSLGAAVAVGLAQERGVRAEDRGRLAAGLPVRSTGRRRRQDSAQSYAGGGSTRSARTRAEGAGAPRGEALTACTNCRGLRRCGVGTVRNRRLALVNYTRSHVLVVRARRSQPGGQNLRR